MMKSQNDIIYSHSPKIAFEVLIAKICHLIAIPNLEEILVNIANINKKQNIENFNINDLRQNKYSENPKSNNLNSENELVNEILRNFTNSQIIT